MISVLIRKTVDLRGIVQGVGFRPALLRFAREAHLDGWVQNRAGAVRLALEGREEDIDAWLAALPSRLPPNARIDTASVVEVRPVVEAERLDGFRILDSAASESPEVLIPADLAVCGHCLREVFTPGNRRYGYPFTTCTQCGPRYTVVNAMPYDRERTTLSVFPLCPACRREYDDPADRRFHAESIACPECGPRLFLETAQGKAVEGNALRRTREELARGAIVAVRGIGGFLLAADAFNASALSRLRDRKRRPHKPFAVMAPDLAALERFCRVTADEARLLASQAAPIVILDARPEAAAEQRLPLDLISPDVPTLGAMLPTSPLHWLLCRPLAGDPVPPFGLLIMTSGNRRGEPICIRNDEARDRLRDIADFLLLHDREINLRNDDSLCLVQRGGTQVWRRARGFAPNPIPLSRPLSRCVLAMGAEIKNAVAVGYARQVVMSPHVGDLETPEALDGLATATRCLPEFLGRSPETIAVDLHPDMRATVLGRRIAGERGLPVEEVQHHHAHAAACAAEHGVDQALALVFDGTGLGSDGAIWGAEMLEIDGAAWKRLATFAAAPLPGGDAAVRHPARQAVARWLDAGVEVPADWRERLGIPESDLDAWRQQCRLKVNAPPTHAAGRVFDAFSAMLGVAPPVVTYEGQPAIRLEALARRYGGNTYPEIPISAFEDRGMLFIDWRPAFRLLSDPRRVEGREAAWAVSVHRAVAQAAATMIDYGLGLAKARTVALSGGVFMNRILNDLLGSELENRGLRVLIHRDTPPNDGCIALGQAVVAGWR